MTTPTIPAGNLYMNATLYTGTGATQSITNGVTGASFQPDFVWGKSRSNAVSPYITDTNIGLTNQLRSDATSAQVTGCTDGVTSVNSNGFTLGAGTIGYSSNTNGYTYVAWQWKAGGTAVSNTSGTITSSVSANTTSGFSVVTYTGTGVNGATVGHGLGVAPSMIISKVRSTTNDWPIYHISMGNTGGMYLNLTNAFGSSAGFWNNTSPTSTVFTVTSGNSNVSGQTYVAYCWTPIAGYSAFGSYTGNGSADGPFVYTGFRPRFVMIKRTDSATAWDILDSSRSPSNVSKARLQPNTSSSEDSTYSIFDLLSNGFKLRDSDIEWNANGGTYIYAAFAENPFKYALAR